MIGRGREWEQLHAAWRHASTGDPGFALITGAAGIGKSRLAEELLAWVYRQGDGVATTRSYAAEGQLSLAPVTELRRSDVLRPHLARLDPVWRTEVSRVLPELLVAQPDLPSYEPMVGPLLDVCFPTQYSVGATIAKPWMATHHTAQLLSEGMVARLIHRVGTVAHT